MLQFKDMREDDIVFITDLLNENNIVASLHNAVKDYQGWLETYNEHWKNDKDEKHFIIYSDEIPVGWLKINGLENEDTAWIAMLVVSSLHQQKGIGKCAISFSEEYLQAKGFQKIGIHTTDDNIVASKLYDKCGYNIIEHGECTTGDGANRMGYTFIKSLVE
jgi:ribosomal protein S18 acetylase RimI-like enzyme